VQNCVLIRRGAVGRETGEIRKLNTEFIDMCDFWTVTTYFNPLRYDRRLQNYRLFRRFLGAPLLTVEWSPDRRFQLEDKDADLLVQIGGGDLMWQKERLLNVALERLPDACRWVAWIDCDLVFQRPDWTDLAREKLEQHLAVQLFRFLDYAPREAPGKLVERDWLRSVRPLLRGNSLVWQYRQTLEAAEPIARQYNGQIDGAAWAAPREVMQHLGFYDARVVGGGGMALFMAIYGRAVNYVDERDLPPAQADHYLAWSEAVHGEFRGNCGFVDGLVHHLWHGDLGKRQYRSRQGILNVHRFDPAKDIAIDDEGCWRWNSEKPELHHAVAVYFKDRDDDGVGDRF
jgi:hypothetical protein